MMQEVMSKWTRWFETLKVWVGQQVKFSRLAWLVIKGIPLHLWDASLIDQIGNRFGRVVINLEILRSGVNFLTAKICILTSEVSLLNERVEIKVGGTYFPVGVSEENLNWSPIFHLQCIHPESLSRRVKKNQRIFLMVTWLISITRWRRKTIRTVAIVRIVHRRMNRVEAAVAPVTRCMGKMNSRTIIMR